MRPDFRTEWFDGVSAVAVAQWDALVQATPGATVFQRHGWLAALERNGCVGAQTGWQPRVLALRDSRGTLSAACALYVKSHSYGEYVFDWGWAQAYAAHGLAYYPKLLLAVPFTPVRGAKLLGVSAPARQALLRAAVDHARSEGFGSLHALFLDPQEAQWAGALGLLQRTTLQFHWHNTTDSGLLRWTDFDAFVSSMRHDKRKKIRQEQRQVREAGVSFRVLHGDRIEAADWTFFAHCYAATYAQHGATPYLSAGFFRTVGQVLSAHCLLFVAQRAGRDIASSLVLLDPQRRTAYGRYWGSTEFLPALHFDACYYQPIAWCLRHGYTTFEGGAQGEHKIARGLEPVATQSAHWLAHPGFAGAVEEFLAQESAALAAYQDSLNDRLPFKAKGSA
ncbi:MAG: GNAT family N-acetyltransferase [Thiomonas sp.]